MEIKIKEIKDYLNYFNIMKCKKCGIKTNNKSGYCDKCLADNSSNIISECLDISDEQFKKMVNKLVIIFSKPKFMISDKLLEIKNTEFNDIEKIYMGFLLGTQIGEKNATLKITKDFIKLFEEHPELRKLF